MSQQVSDKPRTDKVPGRITQSPSSRNPGRVVVKLAGQVIADTQDALTLREAAYPAVQYIPRRDVDMATAAADRSHHLLPLQGRCGYFSIPSGGERSINAVWTYPDPYDASPRSRTTSPSTPTASTRSRKS